ncbi:hypothetical protein ABT093_31555 [Kitasatospora sp. NPDC002551]|uniref:hypothetical protein n=1 Tax=Kitasatospora sp. NPDC002551 TaxID=3154539 RepID=UPI00332C8982
MRAKHATRRPEPARRTVGGGWRAARRWLSRPRTVAAGGALLAQLWGFGAPVALAAGGEPLPEPAGRTLATGAAAPDGTVRQPGPGPSDGLLDGLAGAVPAAADAVVPELDAATGPVTGTVAGSIGGALQDRIRAGGLPLPGQRAALPDAFALASGLLGLAPAGTHPAETRAARDGTPDGASGKPARPVDAARPVRPGGAPHGPAAPPPAPAAPERPSPPTAGPPAAAGGGGASGRTAWRERGPASSGAPAAGTAAPPGAGAARTAAVTVAHDTAGTATSVLAPITAGLLLTGAAMYKHRGLPKGH